MKDSKSKSYSYSRCSTTARQQASASAMAHRKEAEQPVSQTGNAYEEGLVMPGVRSGNIGAAPTAENRERQSGRTFRRWKETRWGYTHGRRASP